MCWISKKSNIKASDIVKMLLFDTLKMSNMISRKIWVSEKLLRFYIVLKLNKAQKEVNGLKLTQMSSNGLK